MLISKHIFTIKAANMLCCQTKHENNTNKPT